MAKLDDAIEQLGGTHALAQALGVSDPVVSNWRARGRVPAEHCRAVEEVTHGAVTRYDLRPDIFGRSPDASDKREVA